jgi:cell wall-associated NlpC family hydrolase
MFLNGRKNYFVIVMITLLICIAQNSLAISKHSQKHSKKFAHHSQSHKQHSFNKNKVKAHQKSVRLKKKQPIKTIKNTPHYEHKKINAHKTTSNKKKITKHKITTAAKIHKKSVVTKHKKTKSFAIKKSHLKSKPHHVVATKNSLKSKMQSPAAVIKSTPINHSNLSSTPQLPAYSLSAMEKKFIDFVHNTIAKIRYTAYKLGGAKIDSSKGIYIVDCSRYVDHILKNTYPKAYTSLTAWSGSDRPTSNDYYHYFATMTSNSSHWNTVEEVTELRPGDVLVFRQKNRQGKEISGHVMVVMDKPIQDGNTFLVRIADSAPSRHSKDTRMPRSSGIGIGTILLKANPHTFQPYAYAWKIGSRWENNVNFAMARPLDLT